VLYLKNLEKLQVVVFQPGLGGMFLTNLFNLADTALDKSRLESDWLSCMHRPVTGMMEHENTPSFGHKAFFGGLHCRCHDDQIDLWLLDIALKIIRATEDFHKMANIELWWDYPSEWIPHRSIYVPGHAPGHGHDFSIIANLNRIGDHALARGVTVSFIIVTVYDTKHMTWACQRHTQMLQPTALDKWIYRQKQHYHEAVKSPYAVELNIDAFLDGDAQALIADMRRLMVGMLADEPFILQRAQAFLDNKFTS
jgi:hypothetical protein